MPLEGGRPFLDGTLSFNFTIDGITSSTAANDPVFSSGTDRGDNVEGTGSVAEPGWLAPFGSGLLIPACLIRR